MSLETALDRVTLRPTPGEFVVRLDDHRVGTWQWDERGEAGRFHSEDSRLTSRRYLSANAMGVGIAAEADVLKASTPLAQS
jgi:hypothetical protein